jgi:hypothetical protein
VCNTYACTSSLSIHSELGSLECYDALKEGTEAFVEKLNDSDFFDTLGDDFAYPYSVTSYEDGLDLANRMFKFHWVTIAQYNHVAEDLVNECSQLVADYKAAGDDGYTALSKFAKRWVRNGRNRQVHRWQAIKQAGSNNILISVSHGRSKEKRRRKTEKMLFSSLLYSCLFHDVAYLTLSFPSPLSPHTSFSLLFNLLTRIYVYILQAKAARPKDLSSLKEAEELQQLLTSNARTDFKGFEWQWQFCNEVSGGVQM